MLEDSATIDELEAKIIRCIQLSPRAPFRTIAHVLDVSEQTVARRFRRLERSGVLRVTIIRRPAAHGQSNWLVRVQVRPSGSESLARALAQRDDVSWVTLVSGGSEVLCVLRSRSSEARDDLLMQKLPRTAPVLGISASMVIHRFVGIGSRPVDDWSQLADLLDDQQEKAIMATAFFPPLNDNLFDVRPRDVAMLDVLARDGRAPIARLAEVADLSPARATRRLTALVEGGAAYFDVDVSPAALGLHQGASLWLTVAPSELDRAGHALSLQQEVAFAGAVTGSANLAASIVCRDAAQLYRFVTDTVGSIPGITAVEVLPVLRHVKQAGTLVDGDRLGVS